MPGIILFRRRWAIGSDDMVLPVLVLIFIHSVWLVAFVVIYEQAEFNIQHTCSVERKNLSLGNIIILSVDLLFESVIVVVSLRGGILDIKLRASIEYLLYTRLVIVIMETTWIIIETIWLVNHYTACGSDPVRDIILGQVIYFWPYKMGIAFVIWCAYDYAGGTLVKIQRYQENLKDKSRHVRYTGSALRKQRQRRWMAKYIYRGMEWKAFRQNEMSWGRRFKFLCCCCAKDKGGTKDSMRGIAQILAEFFRDMDVVASDVIAGLILIRRYQKQRMISIIQQETSDTCRYLSGIPITPRTEFLQLGQPEVLYQYKQVIHYMKFALAAYGFPVYMMMNACTGLCKLLPHLSCCCCRCCCKDREQDYVIEDNCCDCNSVALKKLSGLSDAELVYITYCIDQTPFYVALDNKHKKIVITVRGTLALQWYNLIMRREIKGRCPGISVSNFGIIQDVLTDLKAEAETIPTKPARKDWVGHKGMVQAAIGVIKKLKDDEILEKAFEKAQSTCSERYGIVLVGHSLGAGTAAILAILLQNEYPDLHCYAYSPPGNLLSLNCVQETRKFITSVVVGQDFVARIGVMQMELLRTDLANVLKKCKTTKWKIILKAMLCGSASAAHFTNDDIKDLMTPNVMGQPSDMWKRLSAYKPLYPPGKIIAVVRNHSRGTRHCCQGLLPVYQAIWMDNSDFQEVLISPKMLSDHMPDNVMGNLEKVLDSSDFDFSNDNEVSVEDGKEGIPITQFVQLTDSVAQTLNETVNETRI